MSFLDGFLGQLTGGNIDIPTLAQMVGLPPDQTESAVVALGQAYHQTGDTVETAAANTGLPADKLSALVRNIGGEEMLAHVASFMGAGEGDAVSPSDEVTPAAEDAQTLP